MCKILYLKARSRGAAVVVDKADELRPPNEVGRRQGALEPGVILLALGAGQVLEPGRLALADAVLDPGVLAVAELEGGHGAALFLSCVTRGEDEGCVAEATDRVEQAELGTGMRPLLAHDHPRALQRRSISLVTRATKAPSRCELSCSTAGRQEEDEARK